MNHLHKLQARRLELLAAGRGILDKAHGEGRSTTDAEREAITANRAEVQRIDEDLVLERAQRGLEAAPELGDVLASAPPPEPAKKKLDTPFRTFGHKLQAIVEAARHPGNVIPEALVREQEMLAVATGLGSAIGSDGGFLVSQDEVTEIVSGAFGESDILSRVRTLPISEGADGTVVNGIDESSRVTGSRWGGVQAYWCDAGDTVTPTKPKFRRINMKLHKLMALVYATDENLKDAVQLQGIIQQALPEELTFMIENSIVNGLGAGQPLGFLNAPVTIEQAIEGGQAADSVVFKNVLKMWSRMHPRSRRNAIWMIDQSVEAWLYQMAVVVGTGGAPVFLPAGGASQSPLATLFGRPIIPCEYCQPVGDVGDILLADLGGYVMIAKGGIESAVSMHVRFLNDEQVFRFIARVDGQPLLGNPITPASAGATVSPFVKLGAR